MSASAETTRVAQAASFAQRHHFWIRRLHSLSGVVPLGVFLVMHLSANASILGGEQVFDSNVGRIHALGPLLVPVEIAFIFLPLAFHIGVGLWIAQSSKPNVREYSFGANVRYALQRTTAYIATLFILYHLWHMHWVGKPLGGGLFNPEHASSSAASAMQRHPVIGLIYAVGVGSTVYHFANGLWTALITWGITVGRRSQRVSGVICALIGLAVGAAGIGAVLGFTQHKNTLGVPVEENTSVSVKTEH